MQSAKRCAWLLALLFGLAACIRPWTGVRPKVQPTPAPLPALQTFPVPGMGSPTPEKTVVIGMPATAPAGRPNIVVILVDDMEAGAVAFMPQLQALLVEQGASFQNFYVNVSLCCPSRASLLRGQLAHNTRIYANLPPAGGFQKFQELGEEASTIATWLQAAGYRTALVGKYLNGYPLPEDPAYIPPGWDEWYSPAGGKPYTQYHYTLNENGRLVEYRSAAKAYGTDVLASKAVDFVTRSAAGEAPFFALIAPYAPHGPATPARRHTGLFGEVQAPRDPSFNERGVKDKPAYIRSRPPLEAEDIAQIDQLYRRRLRSLQAVDELIAGLVEALRSTGALENTYLFFTSDNGFMLGQHRLGPGKVVPYEESVRVPLVVRGPGVPAGVEVAALTGNIDLAPTWAMLGGALAPGFVDGRSLVPLWREAAPSMEWRQAYLIEYGPWGNGAGDLPASLEEPVSEELPGLLEPPDGWEGRAPAAGNGTPIYRALRLSDETVYIEYATGEKEFYDLNEDPYQLINTAALLDPSRQARLAAWLEALSRCAGPACRSLEENSP